MRLLLALAIAALALTAVSPARSAPTPVAWCGHDEVSANRQPDNSPWQLQKIRFVYAVPSDGADHFLAYASGMATDAEWIDQWWQRNDPTRTPRFDLARFAGCATTFGALDIGFVRLPHSQSFYTSQDNPAQLLDDDLANVGVAPDQKTVVYFDGPSTNQEICGVTDYSNAQGSGGRFGFAYVLLQSGCLLTPGQTTALTAAHELIHNLGAVPPEAPHTCPDAPAHVCDSQSDIMWPDEALGESIDSVSLDVGRDDYYGHSGLWWDVQDSGWLVHLPLRRLFVAVQGQGTLTAAPAGLACSRGCDVQLENETLVQLTPSPAAGWIFAGWVGDCKGTGACAFSIAGARTVSAVFAPSRVGRLFTLRVVVHGRGRVVSSRPALSCESTCTRKLGAGAAVKLIAQPLGGYRFSGWSGACRGHGACSVHLDRLRSVTATFVHR